MKKIKEQKMKLKYRICSLGLGIQIGLTSLFGMSTVVFPSITVQAQQESQTKEGNLVDEKQTDTNVSEDEKGTQQPSYVNAKAAVLIDATTGQILFEQNGEEGLPPASTTKVMTALLTIEAIEDGKLTLDQKVTVDHNARHITPVGGSTIALPIEDDEIVTVEDLLYAVLLKSDCVCCNILAEVVSGSVEEFVEEMNQRAKDLGCQNTIFLNSHGFKEKGHVMSAHDLALIGAEAMQHKMFYEIVNSPEYTIPATNLNKSRDLRNTNWLLGTMYDKNIASYGVNYQYEYAHGIKTGFTDEAGHCLVSYAEKDGHKLVCAILGATIETNQDTGYLVSYMYSETIRLYNWGFDALEAGQIAPDGSKLVDAKDEERNKVAAELTEKMMRNQGEAFTQMAQSLTETITMKEPEKEHFSFHMPSVMRVVLLVIGIIAGIVILIFVIQFVRRNFYFDFRR